MECPENRNGYLRAVCLQKFKGRLKCGLGMNGEKDNQLGLREPFMYIHVKHLLEKQVVIYYFFVERKIS